MIAPAILTWVNDLWAGRTWDQAQHEPQIGEAFRTLRQSLERWPTMRDFREAMHALGRREVPVALPAPQAKSDPRARLVAIAHVRKLGQKIGFMPPWAGRQSPEDEAEIAKIAAEMEAAA